MHSNGHIQNDNGALFESILLILPALVIGIYIAAVVISSRRYQKWPLYRTFSWILGIICAASAIIGPIANQRAYGLHCAYGWSFTAWNDYTHPTRACCSHYSCTANT